jgi:hypothetical protein
MDVCCVQVGLRNPITFEEVNRRVGLLPQPKGTLSTASGNKRGRPVTKPDACSYEEWRLVPEHSKKAYKDKFYPVPRKKKDGGPRRGKVLALRQALGDGSSGSIRQYCTGGTGATAETTVRHIYAATILKTYYHVGMHFLPCLV